jgi:hypothetical protein
MKQLTTHARYGPSRHRERDLYSLSPCMYSSFFILYLFWALWWRWSHRAPKRDRARTLRVKHLCWRAMRARSATNTCNYVLFMSLVFSSSMTIIKASNLARAARVSSHSTPPFVFISALVHSMSSINCCTTLRGWGYDISTSQHLNISTS